MVFLWHQCCDPVGKEIDVGVLKIWTRLREADLSDECAAELLDDLLEFIEHRGLTNFVAAASVALKGPAVLVIYFVRGVRQDAECVRDMARVLKSFGGTSIAKLGFAMMHQSKTLQYF